MSIFDILINLSQDSNVKYEYTNVDILKMPRTLKMVNHNYPWSISETEFYIIYDTIVKNNLKTGYEIATGFGISALAAAIGFKKTNGKLITMDAYIEEETGYCDQYDGSNFKKIYANSDGYKSVNNLIKYFELEHVLFPKIGFSPIDTKEKLSEIYDLNTTKLDYIFIDGFHNQQSVEQDFMSIIDFINKDKFIIFFHDFMYNNMVSVCQQYLNSTIYLIRKCMSPYGFNMAITGNIV